MSENAKDVEAGRLRGHAFLENASQISVRGGILFDLSRVRDIATHYHGDNVRHVLEIEAIMIDIDTPEARAKLRALPHDVSNIVMALWDEATELDANYRSYARISASTEMRAGERLAKLRRDIVVAGWHAAIVSVLGSPMVDELVPLGSEG
jgi:hypothetical protein